MELVLVLVPVVLVLVPVPVLVQSTGSESHTNNFPVITTVATTDTHVTTPALLPLVLYA